VTEVFKLAHNAPQLVTLKVPPTHRPIQAPVSRRTVIMEGEAVVRMRSKASVTEWLAVYSNAMWLKSRHPNAHR